MRSLLLILLLLAAPAAGATKPNIVFILVDDLGWGDLSCYGQANWQTPRIDRMAGEGLRFTDAYAGSTVCAPSRASLLTGVHTGRVFMRGNGRIALRPDPLDTTIATRLQNAGYTTAMIGKSSVACRTESPTLPNEKGFDHFFGILDHAEAHRNYPTRLVRNGERIELAGNNGKTGETYANELFVQDAVDWLTARDETPFFLLLSLTPPHADLTAPDSYIEPFRGRFEETPLTTSGYYHTTEPRAAFAGMVAFLDEAVGRVLDTIDSQGLAEDTLVIFASDNGPHSEGGADADFFDSNGPFRGGKRDVYEGGIRTPQIARWIGTIDPGRVTDHQTAFQDFAPTALDLAGKEPSRDMTGHSIAPLLRGETDAQPTHRYLYWEFHEQGGKQAVRSGDWKAVRLNANRDPSGPLELYDLASDPGEATNVAEDHPDTIRLMNRYIGHAHRPSPEYMFGIPERSVSRQPTERHISNEYDRLVLDRTGFSIAAVSSEAAKGPGTGNGRAANMLDNDPATSWHTEWQSSRPTHPHSVTIDLGGLVAVRGLRLMASQDPTDHGNIRTLRVTVSDEANADGMTQKVELRFTKDEQQVLLKSPWQGRYLTLTTERAFRDSPFASLSNLEVLGTPMP